jgi:hypothetical protein
MQYEVSYYVGRRWHKGGTFKTRAAADLRLNDLRSAGYQVSLAATERWTNYPCGCEKGPGDANQCEECYPPSFGRSA